MITTLLYTSGRSEKNKRNQAIAEGGPRSEEKNVAEKGMKVLSGTTNPGFCTRGTCTICSGVSTNGRLKSSIQEQAGLVNPTVARSEDAERVF